ncbi:NAD(P)-binding protein [Saccharata proteae CBS 121410]|uniref:NAD(P)-binding protein n=1 Tax=Saccharata proteae CBS 121410 TaxID=1314787 RepID=A0A9P4I464_9PEZI|nr:NAD(P)-binding protein [Saccharata proteae CBS 121410]
MSTTAVLAGGTGLVGSNILTTLISHPTIAHTYAFARRALPTQSPRLSTLPADPTSSSTDDWPTLFPAVTPDTATPPRLFLSALGSTRAAAGGLANQRKIDYDLNLALAKAAKDAGVTTYVLISTTGANSAANATLQPYPRMKGELEDAVKALGFEHTVILRPGLIVGRREESRFIEAPFRYLASGLGSVTNKLKDFWAQDAEVIARAAVSAGLKCVGGERETGVWMVTQADIIKMGREEWNEKENVVAK